MFFLNFYQTIQIQISQGSISFQSFTYHFCSFISNIILCSYFILSFHSFLLILLIIISHYSNPISSMVLYLSHHKVFSSFHHASSLYIFFIIIILLLLFISFKFFNLQTLFHFHYYTSSFIIFSILHKKHSYYTSSITRFFIKSFCFF